MIALNVRSNIKDVVRELGRIPDDVQDRATVRALNATIRQARTDMARGISKEFRVGVSEVKDRLSVSLAKRVKGEYRLYVELAAKRPRGLYGNDYRGMNLIHFVEKSVSLAQMRKRVKAGEGGTQNLRTGGAVRKALQLRFQIKRSGGKKMLPGAFIATSKKTGGTAVFMRVGKERMPIETRTTIDVPQMFNTKRINEVVVKAMLDRFDANFRRELRVVLQGWAK